MLNFDEEIKKFQPILDLEGLNGSIKNSDLNDMVDMLLEMMKKSFAKGTERNI